jgi:hypothetical protein
MKYQKLVALALAAMMLNAATAQNQGRSIGRGYSKKLLDQEKHFDDLKKSNGEKYGNKEISVEIAVGKMVDINLDNTSRTIEIKTWDEPKVKISTIVYFDGAMSKLNSESWFEKLNIKTKLLGNSLRIKTDALNNGNFNSGTSGNNTSSQDVVEVYSVDGQYIKSEPAKKRVVTIYVPKENKLNLETKYADVAVTDYLKKLTVEITNGNLELNNVNTLSLRSKYANVSINEVQSGEIDFINGKLSIGTLGEVELDTKYATIEITFAKKLNFKSTNDDYDLEEVAIVEGSKNYGSMRIMKLNQSLQLDGTNADIKVKNIAAEVNSIWIDNKYADLRLPLKNIRNFSLIYDGTYSTIYKNFATTNENDDSRIATGDNQNSKYSATVGTGRDTKINIKCQNCTVDLK